MEQEKIAYALYKKWMSGVYVVKNREEVFIEVLDTLYSMPVKEAVAVAVEIEKQLLDDGDDGDDDDWEFGSTLLDGSVSRFLSQ